MNRTILIDPLNTNNSHLYFNASLISLFRNKDHIVICESNHGFGIKDIIPNVRLKVFKSTNSIFNILTSINLLLTKSIFKKNKIFFLCFDNTFVPFLMLLFYPFLRKNSLSLIVHNNLTTLTSNKLKIFLHKCMVRVYKARIYVLTEEMKRIYDNEMLPLGSSIYFPHPNYRDLIKTPKNKSFLLVKKKCNIILLGRQAKIMTEWFNTVELKDYRNIHFTIVYSGGLKDFEKQRNVTIINKSLSFDDYYSMLSKADFCLFALDRTVENRASGILMDCINFSCPIIAPKVGHYLEYGNFGIGYLYGDYTDLRAILKRIDEIDEHRQKYLNHFDGALNYSSLEKVEQFINE